MPLSAWQERLVDHFTELHRRRATGREGCTLFALEHGLDAVEVSSLKQSVRDHLARWKPRGDDWLAWVVYASEIGYAYDGREYWHKFEEESVAWPGGYQWQCWLRTCFQKFRDEFGGVIPAGIWAEWFTIICWPVTHAVLPTDLQYHLARTMDSVGGQFTADLLRSPERLGQLISRFSLGSPSRFQKLCQDHALVGRIASALLLPADRDHQELILPQTLNRIVADLERVQEAREWLKRAREKASTTTVRGLLQGSAGPRQIDPERLREGIADLGVEPQIVLRPRTDGAWQVVLKIPDFSPLTEVFPQLKDTLSESRCRVVGCRRPLPRTALLCGEAEATLQQWPQQGTALITFEQQDDLLAGLLRTECLLWPGPQWLFRVGPSGEGLEIRTRTVRPGGHYIIVSISGQLPTSGLVAPVKVDCLGVHAAELSLPSFLDNDSVALIAGLGLRAGSTIEFWPAGVVPPSWDGDGRAEWLLGDPVCIGMKSDRSLESISLRLDSEVGADVELTPSSDGSESFLRLRALDTGHHCLRAYARPEQGTSPEEMGRFELSVRHPRVWMPGWNERGPLRVVVDPEFPALEDLWECRPEVQVGGPAGCGVTCVVSFREAGDTAPPWSPPAFRFCLPVTNEQWWAGFEEHVRQADGGENHYTRAHSCELELSAGELGGFRLTCEREFTPIRWLLRGRGLGTELCLLDDRGSDAPPQVARYAFERPDIPERPTHDVATHWQVVPPEGRMFVASCDTDDGTWGAAVVVHPGCHSALSDLAPIVPEFQSYDASTTGEARRRHLLRLLKLFKLWAGARVAGSLTASMRQRDVLCAIVREIVGCLAGTRWTRTETRLGAGEKASIGVLRLLAAEISRDHEDAGWADELADSAATLAQHSIPHRVDCIASLMRQHWHTGEASWVAEFALRLSSRPDSLPEWAGSLDKYYEGLDRLLGDPRLVRIARFAVLAVSAQSSGDALLQSTLYAGWNWR